MMKKLLSGLMATTLAASFAIASAMPLNAAPMFVPKSEQMRTDVEKVQYGPEWRRVNRNRDWRRANRYDRRAEARFYRRGGIGYYRGHRGYREYRRGYREYNGWWFPAAAFVAGALITGAVTAPRASSGSAHVDWCYDRYRSYRASDNTYQPFNGPRRQCYSPYD
jgi:hypothetical protein